MSMSRNDHFISLEKLFDYLCDNEGAVVSYSPGEVIYKQGQPDNRVYRILRGGIAQSKRNTNGEVMIYQFLGAGSMISTYNLSSHVINQPCTARALIESELQQVLRESFKRLLLQNPELLIKITDMISEELQNRDKALERQIYMSAKERVYSILQDLSFIAQAKNGNKHIDFLTRKELADMAGMTEETATRSISKLEREGKIKKLGSKLVLNS